jgi:hypothetical protein
MIQQRGPEAVAENNATMASITRFIDRYDFPKPVIGRVNGAAPCEPSRRTRLVRSPRT